MSSEVFQKMKSIDELADAAINLARTTAPPFMSTLCVWANGNVRIAGRDIDIATYPDGIPIMTAIFYNRTLSWDDIKKQLLQSYYPGERA